MSIVNAGVRTAQWRLALSSLDRSFSYPPSSLPYPPSSLPYPPSALPYPFSTGACSMNCSKGSPSQSSPLMRRLRAVVVEGPSAGAYRIELLSRIGKVFLQV